MVGFVQGLAIEGVKAEPEEDIIKSQSLSDPKKTNGLELDDIPSTFTDSFLDFDSWLMDGTGVNVADLGGSPVDFGSLSDELGCIKKELEVFGDGIFQNDEIVDGLGVKVESLWGLEQENGEIGVVERNAEESRDRMPVEEVVGGDGCEKKLGDLGCLIEEQLGKVNLDEAAIVASVNRDNSAVEASIGDGSKSGETASSHCDIVKSEVADSVGAGDLVGVSGNEIKVEQSVGDEVDSGSDEESEDESSSDSSSSSSSSASSSSDEEDEDSGQKKGKNEEDSVDEQTEIEDGEIMLSDDDMVAWSDNEDDEVGGGGGPIKSKNELKDLPPVPSVHVTLEPHHETLPVGEILSIMPPQVIVEGVEKHNPLNEGSILWITESRTPLGIIDEIFGPVKNPYYIVRYNSENEVPTGIQQGTLISFVAEFADHVLNDKSVYQKGYDASNENDEELSEEAEFSDDEKEAEYRRLRKMKKRGTSESKPGNKRKDKRQQKNQRGDWNNNRDSAAQTPQGGRKLPDITEGQHFTPSVGASSNQDNHPSSGSRQGFAGDQPMIPPFPHRPQAPGFSAPNGSWNNGFPQHQQQNVNLLSGLPPNGMLWMQQTLPYLYPPHLQAGAAFQQQIGMFPGLPSNFNAMAGQPNFGGMLSPWPMDQNAVNPSQFGMNQNSANPSQFGTSQNAVNLSQFGMNQNSANPSQFGTSQNAVNPSQFGMNQNSANPSQFGTSQNAANPSQFGMNQNAVNPSQFGMNQNLQFGMNQNAGNPLQFGMNQNVVNPSQGSLAPNGSEEPAAQSQGSQDSRNMQAPPPAFSFNGSRGGRGGGGGRRGNHHGRGRYGGGRGRRS